MVPIRRVEHWPATDPVGRLLRISPTLPGRAHDLPAARTHRIIRICERQGVRILAARAYRGAGPWHPPRRRAAAPCGRNPCRRASRRNSDGGKAFAQGQKPVMVFLSWITKDCTPRRSAPQDTTW